MTGLVAFPGRSRIPPIGAVVRVGGRRHRVIRYGRRQPRGPQPVLLLALDGERAGLVAPSDHTRIEIPAAEAENRDPRRRHRQHERRRPEMTRDELIEMISTDAGITRTKGEAALISLTVHIGAALAAGEAVNLFGFGRFETHVRPPSTGRNPQTGEPIEIGPKARVRFHMSATLGRRVQPLAEKPMAREAA